MANWEAVSCSCQQMIYRGRSWHPLTLEFLNALHDNKTAPTYRTHVSCLSSRFHSPLSFNKAINTQVGRAHGVTYLLKDP